MINFYIHLARQSFADQQDIKILKNLIQSENEFLFSAFDVFKQDQDPENLIDSMARIIDKQKCF